MFLSIGQVRSVVSDLGLHRLPMSHKKDARLAWVNSGHKGLNKLEYNISFKKPVLGGVRIVALSITSSHERTQ